MGYDINQNMCQRCIMNRDVDPNIVFDDEGICNHCRRYDRLVKARIYKDREKTLQKIIHRIKSKGKGKKYDCIVGISGGVDSSYVAYLVTKLGLRPLAIHLDNGWNTEIAEQNINIITEKLGIDLITFHVDWDEFRDLQLSFLKSSTPDCEIPTDHAINALLWREAARRKIKYIISGMNFSTESIRVDQWSYGHSDWRYIKNIQKMFGRIKLKKYPKFSYWDLFKYTVFDKIKVVSILNYINYGKNNSKNILIKELGWQDYQGKHFESVYTRFIQGYILPKKFGIDKRYGHLSDLINSGQMTREEALKAIKINSYSEELQESDFKYVCRKLEIKRSELEEIINAPPKYFHDYKNSYQFVNLLKSFVNTLRKFNIYPK